MKRLISVLIFTAAYMGLLLTFISIAISSMALKNIIFAVGILVVALLDVLAVRGARWGKIPVVALGAASAVFIIGIIALLVLMGGFHGEDLPAGNNINVYSYVNTVGAKGYRDLERAMESRNVEKSVTELYRYEAERYAAVFYYDLEKVAAYEFYKDGGKYYAYGARKIIFRETGSKGKYTQKETMAADIASCLKVDNNAALNHTDIRPIYGVAGVDVQGVTISGQRPEAVKELKAKDGSPCYFWFIGDLKGQGADFTIEGI